MSQAMPQRPGTFDDVVEPHPDEALYFAAASIAREVTNLRTGAIERAVQTTRGTFRLRGRRLPQAGEALPTILIYVERCELGVPTPEQLRARFGLTRKEAVVARLLAAQKSNAEIAAELSISPHTARHHTERVLAKLDVNSRAEVRAALSFYG